MKTYLWVLFIGVSSLASAQRMASTYQNLQAYIDTCPQSDPYTPIIRKDFAILRDNVAVGNIACTEPYTLMPPSQVTDELAVLQTLRFMYHMDEGRSGYLPWTQLRLYDWARSRVAGINIASSLAGGECCAVIGGKNYIYVGSIAAVAKADNTSYDYQAAYKQTMDGLAANAEFYAHEVRHTEGTGYLHVVGCPVFPSGNVYGCDPTYDETNLYPYAIQFYLAKQWLSGAINLGYSCNAATQKAEGLAFQSLATAFIGRFVTNAPPLPPIPANPGGACIPAATFTLNAPASVAPGSNLSIGVSSSNPQAGWTAASTVSWMTPVSGANSSGSGQAVFSVASAPNQSGTVVVAGYTVTVACTTTCTVAVQPPNLTPAVITGGVVPLYSPNNTIQPGSWISIYGTNLTSGPPATWNGDFPTTLGGTKVTINGKPAYLWYASPTVLNVQAPDDTATGPVPVVVTNSNGTANSIVTLAATAPSFLLLDSTHVTGIILRAGGGYDILGPTGNSLGYPTVAARAGDSVVLFGVGFGPTNPPVPAGQAFSGAAPTKAAVNIYINNRFAPASFTGISSAGLYQMNITIPSGLTPGDLPLQANVGGVLTPLGPVISIQ